ncbi:hypothetical protein [Fodinicurvata sp. EGI_FJ10296]|uniref:phage tail fiber protein n=1 Tax=Fodinicurvata sp. EGI_FJ10296 TaxID=3231908 RepID=UPI003455C8FA
MALTPLGTDTAVAALAAAATSLSLHGDDPGADGAQEIDGGDYARRPVTWSEPENGAVAATGTIGFEVPAGAVVSHIGLWSGAGGFLAKISVPEEMFGSAGEYRLTELTLTVGDCPAPTDGQSGDGGGA